jgi:glycosyltransferase involved in cell wall biosynthesis
MFPFYRALCQKELVRTYVWLLPSLRETVGLTMLEMMLAGSVPIVADNGGPRFAVSDDCGYRIPFGTAGQMSQAIADIIVEINRDRKIIAAKGQLASKKVATHFTEENYRRTVNEVYLAVTRQAKSGTGQLSRPLEAKLE